MQNFQNAGWNGVILCGTQLDDFPNEFHSSVNPTFRIFFEKHEFHFLLFAVRTDDLIPNYDLAWKPKGKIPKQNMKLLDQLTKVKQNNVTRSSCTVALVSLQKPLFSCSFLKFSLQTAYSTSDVLRKVEAFVLLTATRHSVCFREFGTWVQNCGSLWHLWMYSSTSDEAVKKYFVGQLSNLKINFNLVCCLACCCCWRNWPIALSLVFEEKTCVFVHLIKKVVSWTFWFRKKIWRARNFARASM